MVDDEQIERRGSAVAGLGALHAFLGAFPMAYFSLAFITDWAYTKSFNPQWQYFSEWLILAGLVMGGLSILFGLIDWLVARSDARARGSAWHILPALVAWLLALLNAFIHSRDGWTGVVPTGIILSAIVALLMLASGILSAFVYARRA